jgi:hypothetical protein
VDGLYHGTLDAGSLLVIKRPGRGVNHPSSSKVTFTSYCVICVAYTQFSNVSAAGMMQCGWPWFEVHGLSGTVHVFMSEHKACLALSAVYLSE